MAHIEISILCGGDVPKEVWDELYKGVEDIAFDFQDSSGVDILVSGVGPVEVATQKKA